MPEFDLGRIVVGAIAVVAGVIFVTLLIFSVCVSAHEWRVGRWLDRFGVRITGKIIVIPTRTVLYRFETNDQVPTTYQKRQRIGSLNNWKLDYGQSVTVSYLPFEPTVARLAGNNKDNTAFNSAMFMVIMGMVILPIIVIPLTLILWIIIFRLNLARLENLLTHWRML